METLKITSSHDFSNYKSVVACDSGKQHSDVSVSRCDG